MESYITLEKGNKTRSFYVYTDNKAKEKGFDLTIHDFAGYFLFLAGEGWRVVKEINIPVSERETSPIMPTPKRSRKGNFVSEWYAYQQANQANFSI